MPSAEADCACDGVGLCKKHADPGFYNAVTEKTLDVSQFSTVPPSPSSITIYGSNDELLVDVNLVTGDITYGENYDPDEAARTFWNAIGAHAPTIGVRNVHTEIQVGEVVSFLGDDNKLHYKKYLGDGKYQSLDDERFDHAMKLLGG